LRRVFFILTGEGRTPPKSDQDRADLLGTLIAYTGIYRVEGDRWITKVDVAGNLEWIGTEQTRSFAINGDRLQVLRADATPHDHPSPTAARRPAHLRMARATHRRSFDAQMITYRRSITFLMTSFESWITSSRS
jgi:hypothetical protein